ncbi:multidrug resistance protein, putative [Leishmania tarentolae]|uniref:Multidrug resistance protein, putative n=1 Tax=Leishmania tarentolae TaxID=5689 RepID=A0A640KPX5_LEITA|nr:multidrug resistance protein, putative [Leishmania tarentolae]
MQRKKKKRIPKHSQGHQPLLFTELLCKRRQHSLPEELFTLTAQRPHQCAESGSLALHQLAWRAELENAALVHDDDGVAGGDGVQAVRDGDDGVVAEGVLHGALDLAVERGVDVGGCLVHEQEGAAAPEQRARQAQQLTLAHAVVCTALLHAPVQSARLAPHALLHPHLPQRAPHRRVAAAAKGVHVAAHRAVEQQRVLRDHREELAQLAHAIVARVAPAHEHAAAAHLHQPQEGQQQRRLPAARAPHDAHLLPRRHREAHVAQHKRQPRPVPHVHVLEDKRSELSVVRLANEQRRGRVIQDRTFSTFLEGFGARLRSALRILGDALNLCCDGLLKVFMVNVICHIEDAFNTVHVGLHRGENRHDAVEEAADLEGEGKAERQKANVRRQQ